MQLVCALGAALALLATCQAVVRGAYDAGFEAVTCGSAVKLYNRASGLRLHSHTVPYGGGSGQNSVTAVEVSEDPNSYWTIQASRGKSCAIG